jgi:excinuclease ABC subunit A
MRRAPINKESSSTDNSAAHWLTIRGARQNNLKNIDVSIPLSRFACITGVSGSGKSSLINDILREALARDLNGVENAHPGEHDAIAISGVALIPREDRILGDGKAPALPRTSDKAEPCRPLRLTHTSPPKPHASRFKRQASCLSPQASGFKPQALLLDKVIDIDQSPIGRTPRSNPATYIKLFDEIRDLFARLPDSKVRGYQPGRFSFNVPSGEAGGGRCEACEGNGANRVEMDFLADVWATCPVCEGRRFSHETLQVHYRGKSIADVLDMDVQQALEQFDAIPRIKSMLSTLHDVGLDYIKLGQSSTTLSGGEAQRIKLARELVRKSTGRTLYILDEPTTGLHFDDIRRLLAVLHGFVDAGNTVVVIEHNLDVIKTADWVIDLGPEGGDAGGYIVAEGTPEEVARCKKSFTGQSLRELFARQCRDHSRDRKGAPRDDDRGSTIRTGSGRSPSAKSQASGLSEITVVGAKEHNLKDVTISVPRSAITVCSGVSGSGKSSFAIDTVYTEGHRRYVESLSAYARQFLGQLQKPKVDHVHGLSPAIAIEQKAATKSPRSTVGTVTEIYDYLRVLWARIGTPHCPRCDRPIGTQTSDEIVERVLAHEKGTRLVFCAPVECVPGEDWAALLSRCKSQGYVRVRIDDEIVDLATEPKIDARRRHEVEIVVDRVVIGQTARSRIADSVEHCLALGNGIMVAVTPTSDESSLPPKAARFSQHLACDQCGTSYEELTPHHFSFNSRLGWCQRCEGLGVQRGTSADAVIVRPQETLLSGAIAGWEEARNCPLLAAMISALARAVDFDPAAPVADMTTEQRHALLFGLGERWISVEPIQSRSRKGAPHGSRHRSALPFGRGSVLRFQWKGFFPTIDEATRVSWQYRMRLQDLVTDIPCQACRGGRVQPYPAAAKLDGKTIVNLCDMSLADATRFFRGLKLDKRRAKIAGELLHEVISRLNFLLDVGLDYLSLGRAAPTLSGGESQRIRLASQIGSGLTGVLYVLDEPTIGLHSRDNARLIAALHKLRDLGNTLLMVEHDRDVIESADHVLDFGPGAGVNGGQVVAAGAPAELERGGPSLTGQYLANKAAIPVPTIRRIVGSVGVSPVRYTSDENLGSPRAKHRPEADAPPALAIRGARQNNLKNINVSFPLGRFICVTGVSGSGKSSLVTDILHPALAARIHRARAKPGAFDDLTGVDHVDKVINVDQQPIGDSPLSNPATYTGVFDLVREHFARMPEAKVRGYTINRFSFNRPGGRCDDCDGLGQVCYEMHFLPDVWVPCEACGGTRYQRETLEVRYKGKNIADVLDMPVYQALEHFANVPKIYRLLRTLDEVGLGYLSLGQSAPTLSGGEAQRVKLAAELGRPQTGKTVYILDEPTTGLHFDDLRRLLDVLHRLVDLGNTVICIEHNLDVIKTSDWVIDLGPEAGDAGGRIVAEGPPENVARCADSHTGRLLMKVLETGPHRPREVFDAARAFGSASASPTDALPTSRHSVAPPTSPARQQGVSALSAVENDIKMPWQKSGRRWHTRQRLSRDGKPVEWEGVALEFIIDEIERRGKGALLPTDWNDRGRVEVSAKAPEGLSQSATPWFCHCLTGGRWLLDVNLRVPPSTFAQQQLEGRLALKTLNDRDDIHAYGVASRVQMRGAPDGMDHIRILVHDKKEIATPAFKAFIAQAVKKYLDHVRSLARPESKAMPWKADPRAWHLSQKSMALAGKKTASAAIQWKPMELLSFIGRVSKIVPGVQVDWSGKVVVDIRGENRRRIARIITNRADALRVDVWTPPGRFTPTQVEGLGLRQEIARRGSSGADLTFWFRSIDQVDTAVLSDALHAAAQTEAGVS